MFAITDDDSSNVWASGHATTLSAPILPSHDFVYFNGIPVVEWGTARTPDSTTALSLPRHKTFAVAYRITENKRPTRPTTTTSSATT